MKALIVLTHCVFPTRKNLFILIVSFIGMLGSSVYADENTCSGIADKERAVSAAKAEEDWSKVFTTQAILLKAKTECFLNNKMTKENAREKWTDVKERFQKDMVSLQSEFGKRLEHARDAYNQAIKEAKTDEKVAEAKEAYHKAVTNISASYNKAVAALKDKLGIDE